jgi:DNA-directed RNA polymerase specialized sigma24 family protein
MQDLKLFKYAAWLVWRLGLSSLDPHDLLGRACERILTGLRQRRSSVWKVYTRGTRDEQLKLARRILYCEAVCLARRRSRSRTSSLESDAAVLAAVDEPLQADDARRTVCKILSRCGRKARLAWQCYTSTKTYDELAQEHHTSVLSLQRALHKGLPHLRSIIKRTLIEDYGTCDRQTMTEVFRLARQHEQAIE